VKDSSESTKFTAFDLVAIILAAGVIAAVTVRNVELEGRIKDLSAQIQQKESEIRGLERGAAFSR